MTIYLAKIVHHNDLLKQGILKGQGIEGIMETWDYIQLLVAFYINSELPGFPQSALSTSKPTRSLTQRLKGKHGRFRGNLSGKRVDFSGRTVISPDPNLRIDEVAVPILIAKVLTYPERVNMFNRERLQEAILNGPDVYPGANFVQLSSGNGDLMEAPVGPVQEDKRFLKFANREQIARNLKVGDIVERHLIDGDYVLFNRQPSLHRMSIMCHRVKVLPYRTLRFNECVCAPYNADFDGDEMNLHVPQTEEARAEASVLLGVLNNLITPRNGEPLISCTQDFITGSYLMTKKSQFFDRSEFCMLCSYMDIDESKIDLPPPTILKPMEMWTGKQLFSLLIKPNVRTKVFVNLETKNRNYMKDDHFCPSEGYVCFQNSYLVSGALDKKLMGGESKNSLFYALIKNYGAPYAAECMGRVARVTSRWLMNRGFSIGIDDVQPSDVLTNLKQKLLDEGDAECSDLIEQYKSGKLEPQPGCDAEQTLEAILNGKLSQLRNDAGKICVGELHWTNAPLIMALCGSKGSQINISQMVALVGQQAVGGSRIANGFMNRTLPHFAMFSREPDAKGFVANSFYTGLTPTEFFFHTMGGREGLVDTAVKTAETGYMQRRLMKALEDLSTQYDYTVRNSSGSVLQFTYGDDGLDPHMMEAEDGRPVNFNFALMHIRNTNPCTDERALSVDQIRKITRDTLEKQWTNKEVLQNIFIPELFKKEVADFIESCCTELEDTARIIQENVEKPAARGVGNKEHVAAWKSVLDKWHHNRITRKQLDMFLNFCKDKFVETVADPGQAVGAMAGQSIGEPGTQMTLKTFHFAGVGTCPMIYFFVWLLLSCLVSHWQSADIVLLCIVRTHTWAASMNVTLGVPRIVEIINATRNISTPIITAELHDNKDERIARIVKGRIEKTMLLHVARYIREVYDVGVCYIDILLDSEVIMALQLDINNNSVVQSIINTPKLGIKDTLIKIVDGHIRVFPPKNKRDELYHNMQVLKRRIPYVIVCGIPTVNRVVINKNKDNQLYLLAEGMDILAVMGVPGVRSTHVTSNNILELEETLGIEAARKVIMDEIHYTMSSYGMTIDSRHLRLLADVMTSKGEILGIQRFGIRKMRDSVLMLASFEMTTDHLFDAAIHSRKDSIEGVSECIIMGMPIGLGTGLFKLLHDVGRTKSMCSSSERRLGMARTSRTVTGRLPLLSRPELVHGSAHNRTNLSQRLMYEA